MFVKYYTELRKLMHKRNPKLPTNMLLFFISCSSINRKVLIEHLNP